MSELFSINTPRLYQAAKPVIDEAYKHFIRMLPCCICGAKRNVEAAHFGPHGLGQKASDRNCLPLCRKCHRTGPTSYHKLGPVRFSVVHHLDPWKLIAYLNEWYESKLAKEERRRA